MSIFITTDSNRVVKGVFGFEPHATAHVADNTGYTKTSKAPEDVPDWVAADEAVLKADGTFAHRTHLDLINEGMHACYDKARDDWVPRLAAYGGLVDANGLVFISYGLQGLKEQYARYKAGTIPADIMLKIVQNFPQGAMDIPDPDAFALAIENANTYDQAPTTKLSWVSSTTGLQLALASAETFGAPDTTFKMYDRAYIT